MKNIIKYATLQDSKWLKDQDTHIDFHVLRKKIESKEILIAQDENEILGWLRYGFFWDFIPFMNMLFINRTMRGKGIGRQLVEFWESEMKNKKHKLVMTSSQSNEDGQNFFRKLGYIDSGSFKLPEENLEILLYKNIQA